jgi:predicted nucleic acid-binding protein
VILVDTAIWIDHLNSVDPALEAVLDSGKVAIHPFIIGEIALGHLRHRDAVLGQLWQLPRTDVATDREVVQLIEDNRLYGTGIGYIDAHLLAATRLTPMTTLWTRDKRLLAAAQRLNLAMNR